jgi:hypothetical protein
MHKKNVRYNNVNRREGCRKFIVNKIENSKIEYEGKGNVHEMGRKEEKVQMEKKKMMTHGSKYRIITIRMGGDDLKCISVASFVIRSSEKVSHL